MDLQSVQQWIAAGDIASVESAWLDALTEKAPPADMVAVAEALAAAGRTDSAAALAAMLLEERRDLPAPEVLEIAKRLVAAVPGSDELRARLAELYRQAYASLPQCVAGLLAASGLQSGQSPRRALRTLDLCLGLRPDAFLISRFEGRVVQVKRYNEALGQFEIADEAGRTTLLEPKLLADEFEPLDPRDFRVTARYRPAEVPSMLAEDPAAVLIGLCLSRGGRINANDIKDFLVGRFLAHEEWGDWWSRARSAAKRSTQLSLEGRGPIVVEHHPAGRTLEEELAAALESARTPADLHALLQQYLREARTRKQPISPAFAGRFVRTLAEQGRACRQRRPLDALTAALAVQAALRAGAPAPAEPCPSPEEVLAGADKPAELVADLEEPSLWSAGLEALSARPDAPVHLRRLLDLAGAGRLDDVVRRLPGGPADEAVARALAEALADPMGRLEFFLWLWQGPADPPPGVPSRVELLSRLLRALGDVHRRGTLGVQTRTGAPPGGARKEFWQRVRSALAASDYAAFRSAAAQMDEHVAATIKRQVERMEGLAQAVREHLLQVLREGHPGLFFTRETVPPWLEEGTIWTTEAALRRREADYKDLTEMKIPSNARAIGAAAAHGDLSENSEWKFAIEERDMLGARKMKMEDELSRARMIDPQDVPTETVGIGSRVTLRRVRDGREVEMAFLGPWDADPDKGVYSYQTRLAQDLMGRSVGEEPVLKLEGEEETWRIERLASALA